MAPFFVLNKVNISFEDDLGSNLNSIYIVNSNNTM